MDLFNTPELDKSDNFYKEEIKISWRWYFEKLGKYAEFCNIVDEWVQTPGLMLTMMRNLAMNSKIQKTKKSPYFVTISFDDSKVKPEKIPEYMSKVTKKKWISSYTYVIEQRSEQPEVYRGYHVHILLETNKHVAKSDIIREIHSSVKKYVLDKSYIDVRIVNRVKGILDYMEGKKSEEKLEKVENDKPFRLKYNLEDIYRS